MTTSIAGDTDWYQLSAEDVAEQLESGPEGLTTEEIKVRDPERWALRDGDRWGVRTPGGESYALVAERATAWLEEVTGNTPLIAISHGGIGRVLRGLYLRLPHDDIYDLPAPHGTFYHLAGGRITAYEPDRAI